MVTDMRHVCVFVEARTLSIVKRSSDSYASTPRHCIHYYGQCKRSYDGINWGFQYYVPEVSSCCVDAVWLVWWLDILFEHEISDTPAEELDPLIPVDLAHVVVEDLLVTRCHVLSYLVYLV